MKSGEESPSIQPITDRRHHETNPLARPLRILLADSQKLMRQGLCHLFEQEPGLQVVGEAETADAVCRLNRTLRPDLLLLDIALAGHTGCQLIRDLLAQRPATRILVLTTVDDNHTILQALEAGAHGYLLKDTAFANLVQAISATVQGGAPLHPRIARVVLHQLSQPPPAPDPSIHLTARERQVLYLLAQGCSNNEIAKELIITQYTVRTHVCRLLKKLNLANRTQAALYLIKHGGSALLFTESTEEAQRNTER